MKQYNHNYLNVKAALIDYLLIDLPCEIVEISYAVDQNSVTILIIRTDDIGYMIDQKAIENSLRKNLRLRVECVSKADFLSEADRWQPSKYNRLPHLLFSRAELC